ncbi:hypothetical protein AVEN_221678-1, partial [Araneus ventricosus]
MAFHSQPSTVPDYYSYFAIGFPTKANFALSKVHHLYSPKNAVLSSPRHIGDCQATLLLGNLAAMAGLRQSQ